MSFNDHLMHFPSGELCQGCVARKGTEASQTTETVTAFRECVKSGEPFFCHESNVGYPTHYAGCRRLCRGWVNATNTLWGLP